MSPCYSSKVYGCYLLVGYGRPYLDPAGRNESNICEACTIDGIFGQAALDLFIHLRGVSPSFGRRNYAALRVPFTFLRFV
jgi:hypothetical protein